jgi:hypothetical protein
MSKKEQLAQRTIKLKCLQQYNQNLPDSSGIFSKFAASKQV